MIKCAEQSPRICEDGSIRWYEGDTFKLLFELEFTDDGGNVIETLPTDKISICFNDEHNRKIYEYEVAGTNIIEVNIDSETTKKFKEGNYFYSVKRNSNYITTIIRDNKIVVE